MKKHAPYFVVLLAIVISTTSCRKLVTAEFAGPELTPVVNALLIQGKPIELQASYTANIGSTIFDYIDDADISLSINGMSFPFS